MAYDEKLAERIRGLVADEPGLTEKKMFGGLAFLIGGTWQLQLAGRGACSCASTPKSQTRSSPTRKRALSKCVAGR
jgi:hypothetical protein